MPAAPSTVWCKVKKLEPLPYFTISTAAVLFYGCDFVLFITLYRELQIVLFVVNAAKPGRDIHLPLVKDHSPCQGKGELDTPFPTLFHLFPVKTVKADPAGAAVTDCNQIPV